MHAFLSKFPENLHFHVRLLSGRLGKGSSRSIVSYTQVRVFQPSVKEAVVRVQMEVIKKKKNISRMQWYWFSLANNGPDKGWCGRENPGLGRSKSHIYVVALPPTSVWSCTGVFFLALRLSFLICEMGAAGGNRGQNVLPCTLTGNTHMEERSSLVSGHCSVPGTVSARGRARGALGTVLTMWGQDPVALTQRFANWHSLHF